MQKKKRLGELLVEQNYLTEELLDLALKEQQLTGELLGEVLLRLGFVSEDVLLKTLAEQYGEEKKELDIDEKVVKKIPKEYVLRFQFIPLYIDDQQILHVATHQNVGVAEILAISKRFFPDIKNIMITKVANQEFEELFRRYYGSRYNIEEIINDILNRIDSNLNIAEDRSIINLVNHILYKAVEEKASDVHFETGESVVRIKFRIDGILRIRLVLPKKLSGSLITRLKIMANLDISETRLPQDGHFTFHYAQREIDIRIATSPTIFGEIAVLRLLNISGELPKLERLGFSSKDLEKLQMLGRQPYGIILASGPTGSGKTTTLYALLDEVFSLSKCIITVEDPPEIKWDLIRQIAVNERAGLSFQVALRSILRQDPEIILIGEIRDQKTAEIAVKAAETGHLVLSTVHTNTATEAPYRLAGLGVDTASLAPALLGVIGQRLVRKICPSCKKVYEASKEEKQILGLEETENVTIARGEGCMDCRFTGYLGRIVVNEIFVPSLELQHEMTNLHNISAVALRSKAIQQGMKTIYKDAVEKVLSHITTIDELVRVLRTNKKSS